MKLFKYQTIVFHLLILLYPIVSNGQSFEKSRFTKIPMENTTLVEVSSTYANLEFEHIEGEEIIVEANMKIDGLSQKEAEDYFDAWSIISDRKNGKLMLNSLLKEETNTDWQRHGFYEGYFLNETQQTAISNEIRASGYSKASISQKKNIQNSRTSTDTFDQEAYINKGDFYLYKWQKEHKENIGKRWFHKTRDERIALLKASKSVKPPKEKKIRINTKMQQEVKLKKSLLPSANVRPLNKRAVIKKTLKIGLPKSLKVSISMKHGKLVFHDEIPNIKAELKHVLLEAKTIRGHKTYIKGDFTNFEIDHWQSGSLDVTFSGYTLIKKVDELLLTSNSSIVSIDTVSKNILAKGNFKMLNMEIAPSILSAKIDVVDSKKVWIKLPKTPFNLYYKGQDSKLIHPVKFSLKTGSKRAEQVLENIDLKNNKRSIAITALASVMQIYDIPWDDLKIQNLEGL